MLTGPLVIRCLQFWDHMRTISCSPRGNVGPQGPFGFGVAVVRRESAERRHRLLVPHRPATPPLTLPRSLQQAAHSHEPTSQPADQIGYAQLTHVGSPAMELARDGRRGAHTAHAVSAVNQS